MSAAKLPPEMPRMEEADFPPKTISPPPPGEGPRLTSGIPKWMRPAWLPELRIVSWDLLDEHRQRHREAQAAYENACGADPASADQEVLRAALRELRAVAQEAVRALQAEGAAAPAFESFAEHRARLTPPAGGAASRAPIPLSQFNDAAERDAEAHRAFFARHAEERDALKADHRALADLLGPSLNVATPEPVALMLADPEPELPGGNRGEGEAAQSFAEQAADAA